MKRIISFLLCFTVLLSVSTVALSIAASGSFYNVTWESQSDIEINATGGGYTRYVDINDRTVMVALCTGNRLYVKTSTDDGLTWGNQVLVADYYTSDGLAAANSNIMKADDGTLYACCRFQKSEATRSYFTSIRVFVSTDNGATWSHHSTVAENTVTVSSYEGETQIRGFWEPHIIFVDDDKDSSTPDRMVIYYCSDAYNLSVLNGSKDSYTDGIVSKTVSLASIYPDFPLVPAPVSSSLYIYQYCLVQKWDSSTNKWLSPTVICDGPANNSRDGMMVPTKLSGGGYAIVIESSKYRASSYFSSTGRHPMVVCMAFSEDGINYETPIDIYIPSSYLNKSAAAPYCVTLPDGRVAVSFMCDQSSGVTYTNSNSIYNSTMRVIISNDVITYAGRSSVSTASFSAETAPIAAASGGYSIWPSLFVHDGRYLFASAGTGITFSDKATITTYPIMLRRAALCDNAEIPSSYTKIYNETELAAIGDDAASLSGSYWLMNDIELTTNASSQWSPIGSAGSPFTGVFCGNGKTVSGLYIDKSSDTGDSYAGLFGSIEAAEISGLTVSGTVKGHTYVGSVAAFAVTSEISGCSSSAAVTGYNYTGGIVGMANGTDVKDCSFSGTVASSYTGDSFIGGIAGCYKVQLTRSSLYTSYLSGCSNTGSVTGAGSYAGGIAGIVRAYNAYNAISLSGCTNSGAVSGVNRVGGIVGHINTETAAKANPVFVSDCINSGTVTASGSYAGGILGFLNTGNITGCDNLAAGTVTAADTAGGCIGILKSVVQGTSSASQLSVVMNCTNAAEVNTTLGDYAGGVIGYVLTGGSTLDYIDITVACCENSGNVNSCTQYAGGIVGRSDGIGKSSVSVLTITQCKNSGDVTAGSRYAGGITSYLYDSGILSASLSQCANYGSVTCAGADAGGVVGIMNVAGITDCANYGSISGSSSVGGISGRSYGVCSLDRCINMGAPSASEGTAYAIIGTTTASLTLGTNYTIDDYAGGNVSDTRNGTSLSSSRIMMQSSYNTSFDFGGVWSLFSAPGEKTLPHIISLPEYSSPETANVRYLAKGGTGDGLTPDSPLGNLTTAIKTVDSLGGGTVVIVNAEFLWRVSTWTSPTLSNTVTLTSYYDGVDYRVLNNASVRVAYNINLCGSFMLENLHMIYDTNPARFYCNFNNVCFGNGNTMTDYSSGGTAPSVFLGYCVLTGGTASSYAFSDSKGALLSIMSGTYHCVYGGNYRYSNSSSTCPLTVVSGPTMVAVSGGHILATSSRLCAVGMNSQTSEAALYIYGGIIDNAVIGIASLGSGVGSAVYSGNITINITDGILTGTTYQTNHSTSYGTFSGNLALTVMGCKASSLVTFNMNYGSSNTLIYSVSSLSRTPTVNSSVSDVIVMHTYDLDYPSGMDASDAESIVTTGGDATISVLSKGSNDAVIVAPSSETALLLSTPSALSGESYVYFLSNGSCELRDGLASMISHVGFAIRLTGSEGLRYTVSMDKALRDSYENTLDGYTLVEYGILAAEAGNEGGLSYISADHDTDLLIGKSISFSSADGTDLRRKTTETAVLYSAVIIGITDYNKTYEMCPYARFTDTDGSSYIVYGTKYMASIDYVANDIYTNDLASYSAAEQAKIKAYAGITE